MPLDIGCDCQYCTEQRQKQQRQQRAKGVLSFIGGAIATTVLVSGAIVAAPVLLGAAGFASTGIRAGSMAARAHSWIGNAQKASAFAGLMSMGAKGALSPGAIGAMRSVAQVLYAGGSAVSHLVEKDQDGNVVIPDDPDKLQCLQDELIALELLCSGCLKPINRETAGLCSSVCPQSGHCRRE